MYRQKQKGQGYRFWELKKCNENWANSTYAGGDMNKEAAEKKQNERLPYEDVSGIIEAGSLARLLAHKGIISPEEFEWLVIKAYIRPRAEAMNENNWAEIREDLLQFLHREDPKPPQANPPTTVKKKGWIKDHQKCPIFCIFGEPFQRPVNRPIKLTGEA
jgi:hypothetical protein